MNHFEKYAYRLLLAMTTDEALVVLGLPPNPSAEQVNKAYKVKVFENHPDRGGSNERMVEVNVAKEILEGKRPQSFEPKPQKRPVDPSVARRKAEIRRSIMLANIDREREKVERAYGHMYSILEHAVGVRRRYDLREYLTENLAEVLGDLQDEVDASYSRNASVVEAQGFMRDISSEALRLGTKYGALKKGFLALSGQAVNVVQIRKLFSMCEDLKAGLTRILVPSRKLMSLINTREDIPLVWDDNYSPLHQVLLSYSEEFKSFQSKHLQPFEDQMERSAGYLTEVLEQEGFNFDAPSWEQWRLPADFEKAILTVNSTPL